MTKLLELVLLATRNVLRNARRSLLSGASVAIGVAAILCCKSYVDGLERVVLEFVIDAREGAIQVQHTGYGAGGELGSLDLNLPEAGPLYDRLHDTPGVRGVAPRIHFVGMLSNGRVSVTLSGWGVDPAREKIVCPRGPGSPGAPPLVGVGLSSNEADEVVLGAGLARILEAKAGSVVTALVTTHGGSLDTVDLTVVGVYPLPDEFEDKHLALVPLKTAQRLVHLPDRVTTMAVGLVQSQTLERELGELRTRTATDDVDVQPWWSVAPYFRDILDLEHNLMNVIVLIVFVLVVAGIVNTMLMSVLERTREIGTLMALGLRRWQITTLFLLEAIFLTLAASVVGLVLGYVIVHLFEHGGIELDLPGAGLVRVFPRFNALYVGWSVGAALAAGIVGGLIPARRASRLRPIEALRTT